MATSNFHTINSENIFVIYDSEDMWENELKIEDIIQNSKPYGFEYIPSSYRTNVPNMDNTSSILYKTNYISYGEDKPNFLNTKIEINVHILNGYYEHRNLDFDIVLKDELGYEEGCQLSSFFSLDGLISEYMDYLLEACENHGDLCNWNADKFNNNYKSIYNWLYTEIQKVIDDFNNFAKNVTDTEVCVLATLSNGETFYKQV